MKNNLNSKNIVLCISGGIAAYKSIEILRILQKEGANIRVIMTKAALKFVTPMTFEVLSGSPVYHDLFNTFENGVIRHIEWAEQADAVLIAPATANIFGKIANGIADDVLSTFMLAVKKPVLICPAMNTNMYDNKAVQRNLDILENDGFQILKPGSGELACGTYGAGRLPDPKLIVDRLLKCIVPKDLIGKKILITAGPTQEHIDPVRFISNHSSGKMGYAIAKAAELRGAFVTVVSGPTHLPDPYHVNLYKITTADEMAERVFEHIDNMDIIIKVAAVADYKPKVQEFQKIKKKNKELILELERNKDILKELGKKKKNQLLIGFTAETQELEENAGKKLKAKNLDLIVGNIVGKPSSGFSVDNNIVTFFYKDGTKESLPSMNKSAVAHILFDRILKKFY